MGRTGERTAHPYANLIARVSSVETTSGPYTLQGFDLLVEAYTLEAPAAGDVQAAVVAALNGGYAAPASGLTVPGSKVIHSMLSPSDGTTVTTTRVNGQDVHKVSARFTILTQTTR